MALVDSAFGTLTAKVEGGTRSLTGTVGGSMDEGRQAGDVDLDLGEGLDVPEPMLSVGDLAA